MLVTSGCMAERLKSRLLDESRLVDVVCGPDAYRDLPRLLTVTDTGHTAGISSAIIIIIVIIIIISCKNYIQKGKIKF